MTALDIVRRSNRAWFVSVYRLLDDHMAGRIELDDETWQRCMKVAVRDLDPVSLPDSLREFAK